MSKMAMVSSIADKLPNEAPCKCMPAWARYLCFALCFFFGFSLCSSALSKVDNMTMFYIFWVLGTLGAWFSTLFIKSIKNQFKHMTKSADNIICNIVILVCFVLNLILEAVKPNWWVLITPYLVMYIALVYYSLSMIPMLQQCCKSCCKSCFGAVKSAIK